MRRIHSTMWATAGYCLIVAGAAAVVPGLASAEQVTLFAGDQIGACCLPDTTCAPLTEEECIAADGLYQGDGSACDLSACPAPCEWNPQLCIDGNECTDDICAPDDSHADDSGCVNPPLPLSTPCEADEDLCTVDHCDGAGSCEFLEDVVCTAQCHNCEGGCDPLTGLCSCVVAREQGGDWHVKETWVPDTVPNATLGAEIPAPAVVDLSTAGEAAQSLCILSGGDVPGLLRILQGDLTVGPRGMYIEGGLTVAQGSVVDCSAGEVSIGTGGTYAADPQAGGDVDATLLADRIVIHGAAPPTPVGSISLVNLMNVTCGPGGIFLAGNLQVADFSVVDSAVGDVLIEPGGVYHADPQSANVNALLVSKNITISGVGFQVPGTLALVDSMSVECLGSVMLIDDDKGSDTPPDLSVPHPAALSVAGNFEIINNAGIVYTSEPFEYANAMRLGGNFSNWAKAELAADNFNWDQGGMVLTHVAEDSPADPDHVVEAAGEDRGPCLYGWDANFALGHLELENATSDDRNTITVIDSFDNQEDGLPPPEALYVTHLVVGEYADLIPIGCKVYYRQLQLSEFGTISEEDVLPIVEHPADFDGDCDVGAADLALLLGAWGPNPGHSTDVNGDGMVNAADLAIVLGSWGPTY